MYLDRPVASRYWKSMKGKHVECFFPLLQAGVVEYGQPIDLDADIKASCAFELAKLFVSGAAETGKTCHKFQAGTVCWMILG